MSRAVTISADVIKHQRRASDPESSVWVSANAGSGKTHVLTERVLRLMLTGVRPEQILCLTYTKAAAAEMRSRVAKRLGEWTLLDDGALTRTLADLTGSAPHPATLLRARSLFAHALETPGGLKILTIHAFAESVLHRFPREALVPFDFAVIEDYERGRMIAAAREAVIAEGLGGAGAAVAVETLFGLMSDHQINEAISEALAQQRKLRDVVADVAGAKRRLRKLVGPAANRTRAEVLAAIAQGYGLGAEDHQAIFALITPDPTGDGFVDRLSRIDPALPDHNALCEAFLTKERTARKVLLKKADAQALPDIAQRLDEEAARIEGLMRDLGAAELVERSEALLDVLAAIAARYEASKRGRSLLDFDDLIAALARLLENAELGPWVRYKLDSGIAHILVDESQDTNPEQWRIVDALTEDFFNGASVERPRTVFAVGDQKQSIFSFQGADPELFVETGRRYGLSALSAKVTFATVPLKTSFRTLPDILRAVDLTFSGDDVREAVLAGDGYDGHDSARRDNGGMVTLWPPVQDEAEAVDPENWPLTAPASAKSAARQVAERIAREIKGWIHSGRVLGPRGRPVRADDVLILVQTRGTLFQEVIRALVRERLPTPGADRLAVTSHIGVLDLMALGDVLLNPADDLQLAALLRSPLFEVSEDDLYALAQPRKNETLWEALGASTIASAMAAFEQLSQWRARLDFERAFEFFTAVLFAGGGLKRFHARLGPEIDDVMSEFLDLALAHEQTAQPSLQGFLAALRARDIEIKRELAESGGGVRVMTVHGAKGLEAPVVILADAASTEKGRMTRSVYLLDRDPGPLLIHAGSDKAHTGATRTFKDFADAAQGNEYWRKLYVAMTRAEDELYVTGALTQTGKLEGSWYEAIETALRDGAESVADNDGNEVALIYPRERVVPKPAEAKVARRVDENAALLPPLPAYRLRRIIRPSSAFEDADARTVLETRAAEALRRDPEIARREGTALHALLHHLLAVPRENWATVLDKALPVLLPDLPRSYAFLADKAQSILARPELQTLFGADSRGEVPVLAQGTRNGDKITVAGRIDRLVVGGGRVLVIDFKSDASVPAEAVQTPKSYLTQLGLYARIAGLLFPGHEVEAAILWTGPESLMFLPSERLWEAVAGFTIG
ncbi:MAG: double-strand break repair helicase AddA [Devosia sp.]